MSFDPTWPPTGADLESARCRNQFNALNDQNTATNQRIDNIQLIPGPQGPQGIPGNDGAQGPQGPQGEPGPNAFPHTGDAEINGNIKNNGMTYSGGVGIGVSDAGGSGESGVLHGTDSAAGMQIPVVAIRSGGTTAFQIRLDYGGQIDGNGTPTIQNGDLFGYDGMAGCLKPVRGVTQDVTISDGNGGFITLHIQSGLITSITGP